MQQSATVASGAVFLEALAQRNPAWVQLLGLCPLLAVTPTVVNAAGLAAASLFVVLGSNVLISALRSHIPDNARLPVFVLVIATFTTVATLLLEAYAFDLYQRVALFVQIIVTNCMILGRAEAFASRNAVWPSALDALGTGLGFAIALLALAAVRELLGQGTLFADMHLLFGPAAADWRLQLADSAPLPIAAMAPGAFIVAGLLLAGGVAMRHRLADRKASPTDTNEENAS